MSSNLPKNFPGRPAASPGEAGTGSLPKNFTAEMAQAAAALQPAVAAGGVVAPPAGDVAQQRGAAQQGAANGRAPGPEVTRAEIAGYFARRVVELRDALRGTSLRPRLYAIEFPFIDFERDVAYVLALGLDAVLAAAGVPAGEDVPQSALVVVDREVETAQELERIVRFINHGQDAYVLCTRAWQLPDAIVDLVDETITIPRFDAASFAAACVDFYEMAAAPALGDGAVGFFARLVGARDSASDTEWVRNVVPRDFLLNSQVSHDVVVAAVRESVLRRLRRYATDDAFDFADLAGMDEAHEWARGLIDEVRLARAGSIPWGEVGARVILLGARGVGKSTLVRAIAKAAGLRYVEASASAWAPTQDDAGAGWARMNAQFQEAFAAAPVLFFVDDVDVFAQPPWSGMLPAFLAALKGLLPDDRVLVVAGAQASESVRFELRRPGALETLLTMPQPNSQALAKMYEVMLRRSGNQLAQADLEHVGLLSLGMGGREVDLVVRRALRRARKDKGRAVSRDDLAQAIIQERLGPESQNHRRLMAEDELRNTAYHEAGHAILEMMRSRGPRLRYASIIPRENGTLGFVMPGIDESRNSETQRDIMDSVRALLAGRAAEEALAGPEAVTSGCSNDLWKATQYLQHMMTRSGFQGLLFLERRFEDAPELRERAEAILQAEYAGVLALLQRHRPLLDRVAGLLLERQEVSGDELARVVEAYRTEHPLE